MPQQEKKQDITKYLTKEQRESYEFVRKRIGQLKESRQNVFGDNLEEIWNQADKDYIPHRLKTKGRRIVATDDEKGWRGHFTTIGSDDWQSDNSQPNPFIKIQTALGILVDRNPGAVFLPGSKRYEGSTKLMKNLYQRNWEIARSKQQLKLFIFNLAKYGWAIARTYPLIIKRKVKQLVEYNEENPDKSVYEEKEITEYNDVFRENLDPWNCWIDDMARPNNHFSLRDWCWRKVYSWDVFKEEFGDRKLFKYVQKGGVTRSSLKSNKEKKFKEEDLIEVYFYENKIRDLFMVIANDVPVVIEPLPISDSQGNKKLSCWQTYWMLRHAESPYGIGLHEAMKQDQEMLDRVRNMTLDQLVLSIYKMFFYSSTEMLEETGHIKIRPGVGKQVVNPKDIQWLEVPGPGVEAWKGLEMLKKDIDDASAVTPPLEGEVTGKTAFEIAQAKEAALKRLKTPLANIAEALEEDAYLTISITQMIYSIPEIYKIAEPSKIEEYIKEVEGDPALYGRDEEGNFIAKVYREVQLGLERDEKGNLVETEDLRFFRIKPKGLQWEGVVRIIPESILVVSRELDKAMDLEMINILSPMLAQPPYLYVKIAKQLLKIYDKDPKDWLPDNWLTPEATKLPLIVPTMEQQGERQGAIPRETMRAEAKITPLVGPQRVVPEAEVVPEKSPFRKLTKFMKKITPFK